MTFGYMLLSGATVSSRRAFAMIALALLAVLVDWFSISARCLALAAVAIMLMTPSAAMGPSFQMSFAAVAALVAFYESYRVQLSQWHRNSGGCAASAFISSAFPSPLSSPRWRPRPSPSITSTAFRFIRWRPM